MSRDNSHRTASQNSLLRWGYRAGVPANVSTAWGCRAIVDTDGHIDVPEDRQEAIGPHVDALLDYLNNHVRGAWRRRASELLRGDGMRTNSGAELILHHDGLVMIKGKTIANGGYLYVCAYLLTEQDEG
jgi:hypothetical protein